MVLKSAMVAIAASSPVHELSTRRLDVMVEVGTVKTMIGALFELCQGQIEWKAVNKLTMHNSFFEQASALQACPESVHGQKSSRISKGFEKRFAAKASFHCCKLYGAGVVEVEDATSVVGFA